jgi:radical SAM protein with 4Fe4S-binding SPASM domain
MLVTGFLAISGRKQVENQEPSKELPQLKFSQSEQTARFETLRRPGKLQDACATCKIRSRNCATGCSSTRFEDWTRREGLPSS